MNKPQTGSQVDPIKPTLTSVSQTNHLIEVMKRMALDPSSCMGNIEGWRPPRNPTYTLYREISRYPTVALAMSIVKDPVIDNTWTVVAKDSKKAKPSEEMLDAVREVFNPLLPNLIRDSLFAIDYGYAPFEVIWKNCDGLLCPTKFKPLLQDSCTFLVKENNAEVVALENKDIRGVKKILRNLKFWYFTYNPEIDNPYGRSRFENIRKVYEEANQIRERLAQYARKVSGIIVQLHYPDGTGKTESGADYANNIIANNLLRAVSEGKSVAFPNLFNSTENIEVAAALAKESQWKLSVLETDKNDLTEGFVAALNYYDRLIFRGLCRPEREGIEASGGTKSDATTHTETGRQDSAILSTQLFAAINKYLVNAFVMVNYGDQYKDTIQIEPAPINRDSSKKWELIKAIVANPLSSKGMLKKINADELLEDINMPIQDENRGPLEIEEVSKEYYDPRVNQDNNRKKKNPKSKDKAKPDKDKPV